jgi:exonuclease III
MQGIKGCFTLVSLNVAGYEKGSAKKFKSRFRKVHPDIICLQEDIEDEDPTPTEKKKTWTITKAETGEDTLCNSIYSSLKMKKHDAMSLAKNCPVGRSAVMVELSNGIKIVNLHLCGGRFDDSNFQSLQNEKEQELTRILQKWKNIDIILGDFNGSTKVPTSHPIYSKLDTQTAKKQFHKYYSGGHRFLKSKGYVAVKIEEPTSVYGTTPDYIYYNPTRLGIWKKQILPFLDITDHKAIWVDFCIRDPNIRLRNYLS